MASDTPSPALQPGGRITWIDVCRVLGMFYIVYLHNCQAHSPWNGLVLGPFWDFGSPKVVVLMFFFFSGWLQKTRCRFLDWRKYLYFIIPMIVWNFVYLAITKDINAESLKELLPVGICPTFYHVNPALWFLDELARLSLLMPLILRIPKSIRVVLMVLCLVAIYHAKALGLHPMHVYPRGVMDVMFFLGGTLLNGLDTAKISTYVMKAAPWGTLFGVLYFLKDMFSVADILSIPQYTPWYAMVGLCVVLCYGATISRFAPRIAKALASIAPAMFFIYVMHFPLFALWGQLQEISPAFILNPKLQILSPLICFVIGCSLWKLAYKYLPGKVAEWVFLVKKPKARS